MSNNGDDLYEVLVVNLRDAKFKPEREYFDSKDEALQFVSDFNTTAVAANLISGNRMFAKFIGRVT